MALCCQQTVIWAVSKVSILTNVNLPLPSWTCFSFLLLSFYFQAYSIFITSFSQSCHIFSRQDRLLSSMWTWCSVLWNSIYSLCPEGFQWALLSSELVTPDQLGWNTAVLVDTVYDCISCIMKRQRALTEVTPANANSSAVLRCQITDPAVK